MPQLLTGANGGTFPNTCTGPSPGDLITAASVNTGLQGVLNECKYLFDTKANLAGATFTGPVIFSSTATFNGTVTGAVNFTGLVTCTGGIDVPTGGAVTIQTGVTVTTSVGSQINCNGNATFLGVTALSGTTNLNGATAVNGIMTFNQPRRYRDPARPADAATINVSVNDGDVIILAAPATPRTVVVANASEGDQLHIVMPNGLVAGAWFTVTRADATVIADLYSTTVKRDGGADIVQGSTVTLQVEAGVWRGLSYSGCIATGAGW